MLDRIADLEQDVLWRATLEHKSGMRGCLMYVLPSGFRIQLENGKELAATNILGLTKQMIESGDLKIIRSCLVDIGIVR